MQTLLVILTFLLAVGFLVRKFVWIPIVESRSQVQTQDGGRTKCGNKDCGCS